MAETKTTAGQAAKRRSTGGTAAGRDDANGTAQVLAMRLSQPDNTLLLAELAVAAGARDGPYSGRDGDAVGSGSNRGGGPGRTCLGVCRRRRGLRGARVGACAQGGP